MESAPNEVVNIPLLQPVKFSPSSNTTTTNSNNIGLQQTLEKLLLRRSNMDTSINDLQTRQVQILSGNKISFLSVLLLMRNLVEEI